MQSEAVQLDSLTAEERKKLPLFGIPVSLKENYKLEVCTSSFPICRLVVLKCNEWTDAYKGTVLLFFLLNQPF